MVIEATFNGVPEVVILAGFLGIALTEIGATAVGDDSSDIAAGFTGVAWTAVLYGGHGEFCTAGFGAGGAPLVLLGSGKAP